MDNLLSKAFLVSILTLAMGIYVSGCGSSDYSSDNCEGVDTSQAPFRIQRINYPDGHYSETWYWSNFCSHTYYY